MKISHYALIVCGLVLTSIFLTGCAASPTSIAAFNLSGTATYQGTGSGHVYVFLVTQGANGTITMSNAINNGNSYSFTGNVLNSELYAAYDNSTNGFKLTSNGSGGSNIEQGNGTSLSGSGDVVCLVGYTGACPNVNTQSAQGSFYSANTGINIVFGGTAGQSGTNCIY